MHFRQNCRERERRWRGGSNFGRRCADRANFQTSRPKRGDTRRLHGGIRSRVLHAPLPRAGASAFRRDLFSRCRLVRPYLTIDSRRVWCACQEAGHRVRDCRCVRAPLRGGVGLWYGTLCNSRRPVISQAEFTGFPSYLLLPDLFPAFALYVIYLPPPRPPPAPPLFALLPFFPAALCSAR